MRGWPELVHVIFQRSGCDADDEPRRFPERRSFLPAEWRGCLLSALHPLSPAPGHRPGRLGGTAGGPRAIDIARYQQSASFQLLSITNSGASLTVPSVGGFEDHRATRRLIPARTSEDGVLRA